MKKKKGDKDMEAILRQNQQEQTKRRRELIQSSYREVVKMNGKALEKLSKN